MCSSSGQAQNPKAHQVTIGSTPLNPGQILKEKELRENQGKRNLKPARKMGKPPTSQVDEDALSTRVKETLLAEHLLLYIGSAMSRPKRCPGLSFELFLYSEAACPPLAGAACCEFHTCRRFPVLTRCGLLSSPWPAPAQTVCSCTGRKCLEASQHGSIPHAGTACPRLLLASSRQQRYRCPYATNISISPPSWGNSLVINSCNNSVYEVQG